MSFWVLTAIGLTATAAITIYSGRVYRQLVAEEEAAELARAEAKQNAGAELTPGERRAWKKEAKRRLRERELMEQQP